MTGKIVVHPAGLEFPDALSKPEWCEALSETAGEWRVSNFKLGDIINYGIHEYGSKYVAAQAATLLAIQTLKNIASVSKKLPISRRRDVLTWSHHEAVAALEPEKQDAYLERAVQEKLPVQELRAVIRLDHSTVKKNPTIEIETGPDILSWFADGFRLVRGAEEWTASTRRAFAAQWMRLQANVKEVKLA